MANAKTYQRLQEEEQLLRDGDGDDAAANSPAPAPGDDGSTAPPSRPPTTTAQQAENTGQRRAPTQQQQPRDRPCVLVPRIPLGRKRGYHALTVSNVDIATYAASMQVGPGGESLS